MIIEITGCMSSNGILKCEECKAQGNPEFCAMTRAYTGAVLMFKEQICSPKEQDEPSDEPVAAQPPRMYNDDDVCNFEIAFRSGYSRNYINKIARENEIDYIKRGYRHWFTWEDANLICALCEYQQEISKENLRRNTAEMRKRKAAKRAEPVDEEGDKLEDYLAEQADDIHVPLPIPIDYLAEQDATLPPELDEDVWFSPSQWASMIDKMKSYPKDTGFTVEGLADDVHVPVPIVKSILRDLIRKQLVKATPDLEGVHRIYQVV